MSAATVFPLRLMRGRSPENTASLTLVPRLSRSSLRVVTLELSPVSGDSHDWFLSGVCPLAPRIVPVQVPFKKLLGRRRVTGHSRGITAFCTPLITVRLLLRSSESVIGERSIAACRVNVA